MNKKEEIEKWIDNFEETSQSVGDLEHQYEDLLREKTERMILESEGLDWKSIAYMTAREYVEIGFTLEKALGELEDMLDIAEDMLDIAKKHNRWVKKNE